MPSGAVAGITIGSALIAVSLAGGCYFFCRRFTGRRWRRERIGDGVEENPFALKELDGRAIVGVVEISDHSLPKAELGGRELPASPFELRAEPWAVELGEGRDEMVSEGENRESEKGRR